MRRKKNNNRQQRQQPNESKKNKQKNSVEIRLTVGGVSSAHSAAGPRRAPNSSVRQKKKSKSNQIKSKTRKKRGKENQEEDEPKGRSVPPWCKGQFYYFPCKKKRRKKRDGWKMLRVGCLFFLSLSLSLSLFLSLLCLPGFCSLVFILSFEVREEEPFTVKE